MRPKMRPAVPLPGQEPTQSYRWPNFFDDLGEAEELLNSPGWLRLLQDLQAKAAEFGSQIVHGLPVDRKSDMEQSFIRGKISMCEDLRDLAQDLKEWMESKKKRKP